MGTMCKLEAVFASREKYINGYYSNLVYVFIFLTLEYNL